MSQAFQKTHAEAEVAAREAAVIQRGKEVRQKAAQSKERGKQNEDIDSGKWCATSKDEAHACHEYRWP